MAAASQRIGWLLGALMALVVVACGDDGSVAADPVDALCRADAAFIAVELRAFAAREDGDVAAADRLLATDVHHAFSTWRDAIDAAGIGDEVGPYVAEIETWFDAATDGGLDAYDDASAGVVRGSEADVASGYLYEWTTARCR